MAMQRPGNETDKNEASAQEQVTTSEPGPSANAGPGQQPFNASAGYTGDKGAGASIHQQLRRPLARNQGSEQTGGLIQAFTKIIENNGGTVGDSGLHFIRMDGAAHNMHFSAVVVVALMNVSNELVASAHTLILEGSNSQPRPFYANLGGQQQTEIPVTAMNAWDNITMQKVAQVVSESFTNAKVLVAGSNVVPKETDFSNLEQVYPIFRNANEACYAMAEATLPDAFPHFSIGNYINLQQQRITAQAIWNGSSSNNDNNLPIRNDCSITLTKDTRTANNQNMSSFQHSESEAWVSVNGYVDMVFTPPMQQGPMQQPVTQTFTPRVVLTGINTLDVPSTVEFYLLGLAVAGLLDNNYNWSQQFSNFANPNDAHNIGAVGYRVPDYKDKIKVDNVPDFEDMVRSLVHPNPVFSIDCEHAGPDSWITNAFREAAEGNPAANEYLAAAADRLTNGHFRSFYDGGSFAASENNKVHIGTFVDANGEQRDLREIDLLWVYNHDGSDQQIIDAWDNSYNNGSLPIEVRLEQRLQIIRNHAGGNLRLRGTADRVNVPMNTHKALIQACKQAGLLMDQEGLTGMMGNQYQVGNMNMQQFMSAGIGNSMVNVGSGPQSNWNSGPSMWR